MVGEGVGGPADRSVLSRMLAALSHRGPDDEAAVLGEGFAIGARRLSIVDVERGRQPFASDDGRAVVAMNGEIYDHAALRREMEARGVRFKTKADTEVLLRLFEEEGAACLDRLEGMYAFAAWDGRTRTLLLARDRLGEKPLLCFEARGRIVFGSEWRALREHPDCPRVLDEDALALYLQHRFVPAPRTPIRGVFRLPPASSLTFRDGRSTVSTYWRLPTPLDAAAPGRRADAVPAVRERLEAAVASRLESEVPIGVFLSGGLDSAAIAAIAARRGPIATFTLRPSDADFDEGEGAAATAAAVGAAHHEVPADAAALAAGFEEVFARVDEPIGDSSLVPTLLLARGARRHVKVVLGGEGADELFGGYPTYLGPRWVRIPRLLPRFARRFVARAAAGKGHGNVGTRWLIRRLFEAADQGALERHLAWFGAFPAGEQVSLWRPEARPAIVTGGMLDPIREAAAPAEGTGDPVDALLRADLLLHLPDALLAKVDRATMLEGLEARAPFLERSLVETAARMPARWKVGRVATKRVLREALRGVVPDEVLHRRKRGFAVPVSRALEGALGVRLRERLAQPFARDRFDPAHATALLDAHVAGRADHGRRLYALLALLEWAAAWSPR